MSDDLAARMASFLDAHHVMSLATHGPDGPHAATLFYARDGLALVWVSEADTRHSRDLAASPAAAATIAPDVDDFSAVRGVQVHGRAHRVDDAAEEQRLRALLEARYPFLARMAAAPAALAEAYARIAVWRLDPAALVLIDNSRGFGHKETLVVAADPA